MGIATKMTSVNPRATGDVQVSRDKSFIKTVLHPGTGLLRPNEGAMCVVCITKPDGDITDDEALLGYPVGDEITIKLGDGEGVMSHVIDTCVEMMLPGETCQVKIAPQTKSSLPKLNSKESNKHDNFASIKQPIVYEIALNSFTRDKEIFEMSTEDKVDRAINFKTRGSTCFTCGIFGKAEKFYLRALRYLITIDPLDMEETTDESTVLINTLKCACLLNIAACKLKMKCYEHAVIHCTKALALDSNNVKGLFRRGMAYMELQEYEQSQQDLDHALHLQPTSKPVKVQRQLLHERVKKLDAKYAKAMSKMFGGQ
ncbi:70 kDa peptidyl-prolyl isomerase-like [Asterias rubens]|uniref:70 kDa peptidyl-prolyl isomerase-like n=1 Tax=Asterias rubens TaxID=7604 RepID=UPI001455BCC3|nr:70 kDa peptidyl-prolyl isomerase-like [Asterias rubens]